MRKLLIADYTLRKASEDRNMTLLFREKTAIAASIDAYGADMIELPAVRSVREDLVINRTIASVVKNGALAIPVGEDPASAWEGIREAVHPILQVVLPLSTVQMEYRYHLKAAAMLEKIRAEVSAARAYTEEVEFVAEDASRAERPFLMDAVAAAEEAGARYITLCDDAGILTPDETAALVRTLRTNVQGILMVRVSDALHMAAASALKAVEAGADGLKTAAAGTDSLKTEHISDLIGKKGAELEVETGLNATKLHSDVSRMMKLTVRSEETAGTDEKEEIFLEADAGLADIHKAARALGYELSGADLGRVCHEFRNIAEKKGTLGARELEALIAGYAMQAPSTYHLESFTANCSNITASMANVTLRKGEETFTGVSVGDGPIDAAFRAIEQIVGFHYELDDFQIQAVTEGKEALGSALVRLRSGGKLYSGNGLSTDIVGASIRAYVNALNKIVYEEK